MQHYITPPQFIQPLFSKTLIAVILCVAALLGFVDMSKRHNSEVYQKQAERAARMLAAQEEREALQKISFSKVVTACRAVCNRPPEKEKVVIPKRIVKRPVNVNPPGTVRLVDVKNRKENPNSIRIPLADAPVITAKTKRGPNGKLVGHCKDDKIRKSKKNAKGHIDTQCCLDPDEIPNPRCSY